MHFTRSVVVFATWLLLVSLALGYGGEPTCDFPAIYNFGDSNSDTGGMSAAFWPVPPPYGISYFTRPAGRNCDGRLIIDFIAEHLRLPYLSPYLDSIMAINFRNGANFAAGGSTIRRQINESIFQNGISPFSLDVQTQQFYQFISRTSQLYDDQATNPMKKSRLPRPTEFSKALYTLDIGQNDIINGFRKLKTTQIQAAIPHIVDQFANAVIRLYELGARAIWIHNIGPIGCLPAAAFGVENDYRDELGCVRSHNEMAMEFNRQLKARVRTLRAELSHAAITYVDIYSAKYHLINNAKLYGFSDPMKICCGQHEHEQEKKVHVWCGQRQVINGEEIIGTACSSPATHISWDGVHFSQAANHWIANHILNGSFSDPQKPIAQACFKH